MIATLAFGQQHDAAVSDLIGMDIGAAANAAQIAMGSRGSKRTVEGDGFHDLSAPVRLPTA